MNYDDTFAGYADAEYGADTLDAVAQTYQQQIDFLAQQGTLSPEQARALREGGGHIEKTARDLTPPREASLPPPPPPPPPRRDPRTTPITWGQAATTTAVATVFGFGMGSLLRWAARR